MWESVCSRASQCSWGACAQQELTLARGDYRLLLPLSILAGDLLGDLGQAYLISQHGVSAGVLKRATVSFWVPNIGSLISVKT